MIDTNLHLTNQWSDAPAGSTCSAAGEEMASKRHESGATKRYKTSKQEEACASLEGGYVAEMKM